MMKKLLPLLAAFILASNAAHAQSGSAEAGDTAGTYVVHGTLNLPDALPIFASCTGYMFGNATSAVSCAATASATMANPTGTVGLSVVNGVATTAMRSDAAPALSQSIVPTWTGTHTFAEAIVSTKATGTAPFTVASTTQVSNLFATKAATANAWTTARNLAGNSVDGSANVAFANKFIVQGTTDTGLSAAQFLGALGTCILKNTTTTGVLSCTTAGTDYLTSVGLSFTGGLISVGSTPLTSNGTIALTVAGTSGGIPYFASTSTWASSALLSSGAIMLGGGAGNPPTTTTTGTGVVTALGVNTGTAGAFVVNGGALGTPSSGVGTNLTALDAGNLTTGTLPPARLAGLNSISNVLSGDVAINVGSTFFVGPTMAQGSTGTWWVTGQVQVTDTAGAQTFCAKLWDGTTTIAEMCSNSQGANQPVSITLSGFLATPAGNLRVSVLEGAATGKIQANGTGANKASTIYGFRIN